ncbi:hypothetical protein [Fodinicola feengrottensis]|uniref:hypothetical protein n=1 Tax=Fodinicola feengrottensis TaxID=435914 RepID=UPI0013D8763C|nr:hypothetical protein [Fodinicola feengrottensis]
MGAEPQCEQQGRTRQEESDRETRLRNQQQAGDQQQDRALQRAEESDQAGHRTTGRRQT